MTVCVVGSGAREHALVHVLAKSADVVVTPGNKEMETRSPSGYRITTTAAPPSGISADLFVIGPEVPLVDGLADQLRAKGKTVFGPSADGARLEGSKAFMKDLAADAGVPTARFLTVDQFDAGVEFLRGLEGPYVIKTDGLAAGKGVLVTEDFDEAIADLEAKLSGSAFGDAGRRVVIEEGLSGNELSLLVLCDGSKALALPPARDYKRVGDGDIGPNTGGMGAFSPVPEATDNLVDDIMDRIVQPTIAELRRRDIDYRGVLYAGCMLTTSGPKLIEYNVRFGDPEAQVVLPRLGGDVAELLSEVARGKLTSTPVVLDDAAVCVVVASKGYPNEQHFGDPITGLTEAGTVEGVTIFHAGTSRDEKGRLMSAGGRVLTISALGSDLQVARERAYRAAGMITLDGSHYRSDIAAFELADSRGAIAR